ncbi:MAG: type II/IV secretion system ATPase subunit [Thermoplasmatota archaeon]
MTDGFSIDEEEKGSLLLQIKKDTRVHEKETSNDTNYKKNQSKPDDLKERKERNDISKISVSHSNNASNFGWMGLGKIAIEFDDDIKEYVYTVTEPNLTEAEHLIREQLTRIFRLQTDVDVSDNEEENKLGLLKSTLDKLIETNHIVLDETQKNNIYYYLFRDFIGYEKIDAFMHDDNIEDISCDGQNVPIFIYHREHESIRTNVVFTDDEKLTSFVIKLTQICGKQISVYEPIVDGKLPDGSRLQATLGKTVTKSSTFTIRRFRSNPLTAIDLVKYRTISMDMVSYFWLIMEYGCSILFCGGTASGKTTLLNALSLFIPPSFKIVSIEDTREINLPHENWIAGTSRTGFSSSENEKSSKDIDMFDLIKAALRQRPRVIIVGEVRGKEAYTLFQAMATGHLSYSTIHASDIQTLIQRLESPPISLPRTLLTSLDVIVFLNAVTTSEGKVERRVKSIVEIVKIDPESQRLISVTPFTWVSPIDDRFEYHGGSNILEKIKRDRGWSNKDIQDELDQRKTILIWMQKHNLRSYKEVGRIVSEYKKDPRAVMLKVRADEK